jgi:hypothetical protein
MFAFREYLTEVLDKPWELTPVRHGPVFNKIQTSVKADHPKANQLRVYKAEGDNGHVIEFSHNGAIEIHHADKNFDSGQLHAGASNPNPRFISTMFSRLKHHVNDNLNPVRITGRPKLFNHYHRIVKRMAGKYNAETTEPTDHPHPAFDDMKSFIIKPKNKFNNEE